MFSLWKADQILWVIAVGALRAQDGGGFVGAQSCSPCHAAQAASHAKTGHARALSKAPAGSLGQWAFGAGNKAITYVSRLDAQHYAEHGQTFYTGRKVMGLTPGHENIGGKKYRTLDPTGTALRCFRCHTTGPISLAADGEIRWSEDGVQCESCHGPAGNHVKRPSTSNIVNPKRFSPAEMNDYCGACHRTASDITDWGLSWNSRHEPAFLSQSQCFQKAAVSCLTCHSAHQPVAADPKQYDAKCSACHTQVKHRTPVAATASCVTCHMPSVQANPYIRFTNHWIGIYDKLRPMTPLGRTARPVAKTNVQSPASVLGLLPVYESAAKPEDRGQFLKSLGDLIGAAEWLAKAVETRGAPEDRENLAVVLNDLRRHDEAARLLREAAEGHDSSVALRSWSVLAAMQPDRALEYFEKAVAAGRREPVKNRDLLVIALNNLAMTRREKNQTPAAERSLRQALALDPNAPATLSNLGSLLHSSGRLSEAEIMERQAVAVLTKRGGPRTAELATASTNLGDLLWSRGAHVEALALFRRALEIDRAVYGAEHPELFVDLMNVGMRLKAMGQAQAADRHLREALAIAEKHFGAASDQAKDAREGLSARQ